MGSIKTKANDRYKDIGGFKLPLDRRMTHKEAIEFRRTLPSWLQEIFKTIK